MLGVKYGVLEIEQNKQWLTDQKTEEKEIDLSHNFQQLLPLQVFLLKNIYTHNQIINYRRLWLTYKAKITISEKTFRKRIRELKNLGLIDIIKSYTLLIEPKIKLREEILRHIANYYTSLENPL